MFLRYTVLPMFYSYNLQHMHRKIPTLSVLYFYISIVRLKHDGTR